MLGNNVIVRVSSPAKVILSGEHSVVYGHDAIAFAINLRCYGVVETVPGKEVLEIVMQLQNREVRFIFDPRVLKQYHFKTEELTFQEFKRKFSSTGSQEGLTTQFKITAYLLKYCPNWPTQGQSHRVSIHSDVPIGKCLGSSATFNTVLATALEAVFNRAKLQQPSFLEQVFEISLLFEKVEHGNPSGVDTFLSVYGGLVVFNKNKQPNFKRLPLRRVKQDIFIGLIDSNIPKNTKEAVNRVQAHCNKDLKYRQNIEKIGQITIEIIKLLEQEGEYKLQLYELLNENHKLLRDFGLSNDKIEEIVSEYTIEGHSSTKITGAGMGGYVLVVADKHLFFSQNKHLIQADLEEVGLIFTVQNQCI